MRNIKLYCLFPLCVMVTAVMLIPVTYAKWDDYNPGAGGIKWLPNCDYPGFDIASQPITAEQCGRACIDTVGCNAFSWHDGWCFLKRKPVNVHRSPLLVGGRCGFLPWEFDETPIFQTNNFARSVENTISQVNPQRTNYPLNSPINQQQFSPRKPQITTQRNVQLSPSGKLNIPSILVGKLNSPNHNEGYSDSYHSKDDDEDYGSHQEEDYHREDVIDDEGNQLDDGISDGDNQPAEDIDTEDNQPEEIDDEDNQLNDITGDDNNQPGNVDYDDDQPGDGDYEDN